MPQQKPFGTFRSTSPEPISETRELTVIVSDSGPSDFGSQRICCVATRRASRSPTGVEVYYANRSRLFTCGSARIPRP